MRVAGWHGDGCTCSGGEARWRRVAWDCGRGSRRNSNDSARSEDGSPAAPGTKGWRSKAKNKTFDDDGESQRHVGLITLSVHVTDTGAGILARDKRYIFTPYGRGEGGGGGSTTGGDGGIGLALSQLIAGQHGGTCISISFYFAFLFSPYGQLC